MQGLDVIFYIAILVMSVVIHEVSHGFMAEYFGDKTARFAGRLTLNPIKHLDMFGSIILPALLFLSQSFFVFGSRTPILFGWAKPVPYNPDNLSNRRWGTLCVVAAGVSANFFIAIVFGLIIRLSSGFNLPESFYFITSTIVFTNLVLAVFNLVPIPPLDGSKILFSFFPRSFDRGMVLFEQYSFFLLIIFIFYFSDVLVPILTLLYRLFTGLPTI